MRQITTNKSVNSLAYLGFKTGEIHYQLSPGDLILEAVKNGEGTLTSTQALAVDTGEFTGRSPKDRYIVSDPVTEHTVWWGDVNIPFPAVHFDALQAKMVAYLNDRKLYVRDAFACADERYRISLRVITETAYQNLFAFNLFIRPDGETSGRPEWTIIAAPGFKADPVKDGTRQHNFSIICFSRKTILIGGTGYTGELKKAIFSVLNFTLPHQEKVLSMHCSANVGKNGDTAIFFGLSGTGKTTLSADPERGLIGDDEHGWSDRSVFNIEGGCYAKTINLSAEKEPEIFGAITYGALLENIGFYPESTEVDYENSGKTENTRVSYPLHYIPNAILPSVAGIPKNIFFLTADAFGVLPPISRLNGEQAMYHFISGYTAKVAGTEHGVNEPQATFSACFGKAFLPLHPVTYADLLGKKLRKHQVNVWLVNTGWTGGAYGTGSRIKLGYTRAMIAAALRGELNEVESRPHPVFGLEVPVSCPGVPAELLDPRRTWINSDEYDRAANHLAILFAENFKQFESLADDAVRAAGPKIRAL